MTATDVLSHLRPLAARLRERTLPDGRDPDLLFAAIVEAAYLVAAADGHVDEEELRLLKLAVTTISDPELSGEHLNEMLHDMDDQRSSEGLDARCEAVGRLLLECNAADEGLFLAASMAYASKGLERSELAVLEKVGLAAGVSGAQIAALATSARHEYERQSDPGAEPFMT